MLPEVQPDWPFQPQSPDTTICISDRDQMAIRVRNQDGLSIEASNHVAKGAKMGFGRWVVGREKGRSNWQKMAAHRPTRRISTSPHNLTTSEPTSSDSDHIPRDEMRTSNHVSKSAYSKLDESDGMHKVLHALKACNMGEDLGHLGSVELLKWPLQVYL